MKDYFTRLAIGLTEELLCIVWKFFVASNYDELFVASGHELEKPVRENKK